ncbi:MAG TPA: lipase, partial [Candidatus Binatia bacterium]
SQGGHAGLFAGQLARNYAPELSLKGIAVAAPATDLKSLLSEDIGSEIGKVLGCYTLWSWCKIYGLPQNQIFDPKGDALLNAITGTCIETLEDGFKIFGEARRLTPGFVVRNPASTEPWKSLLERNTPGAAPAGAALYISQGTKDPIVHFDITVAFVRKLQRNGEKVHFVQLPGVRHHLAGKVSAPTAVEWITQRFSDK